MTKRVVEVGPVAIRGPGNVDGDLMSTALDCIDDDIALLDDHPVATSAVWRAVFRSMLPGCDGTVVLIFPTWWSSTRIDRVQQAASGFAAEIVVLQRAQVLADGESGVPTVVEIAAEFVVVWRAGRLVTAEPRNGGLADIVGAVADDIGGASAVFVDAPAGVDGQPSLAGAISARLRADGVTVTTVHRDDMLAAVRDQPRSWLREPGAPTRRGTGMQLLAAGFVVVGLSCVGLANGFSVHRSGAAAVPMTLLIEGRVAVKVPAHWEVRRIAAGPGSARVEATASDGVTAVLVTQSVVRRGEGPAETAGALRNALDDQQHGIFSRFNPADRRADRPVATYREVREGRQIDWTVFVDGTVRIAVGCQTAPGGEEALTTICDEAIRSAHAVI